MTRIVHEEIQVDAIGFAVESILTQPREHKMDYLMYFSSRQLNKEDQIYTTKEREGLAMIYTYWKFQHSLLAKKFKICIYHQALLYLVNKPCTTGRIASWLLLNQEFDFETIVWKGNQHFLVDHMSRIQIGEAPASQTP